MGWMSQVEAKCWPCCGAVLGCVLLDDFLLWYICLSCVLYGLSPPILQRILEVSHRCEMQMVETCHGKHGLWILANLAMPSL